MAVHLGQTFVTPQAPGVLPHLWMVLSDPSRGERVVLANISSRPCPSGEVLDVRQGEHPFVAHTSYLRFAEVRVADRGSLEKLLTTAQLRPSHDLTPDLLRRIQVAVAASKVVPIEAARILTAQGLV
jgi:hypothetical protein